MARARLTDVLIRVSWAPTPEAQPVRLHEAPPCCICRHSDPLALLFQFADAKGGGGSPPGMYKLVTQFPRRVLSSDFDGTISQAGIDPRQEALLLEPTAAAAADE